jgi:hypothetical protein
LAGVKMKQCKAKQWRRCQWRENNVSASANMAWRNINHQNNQYLKMS